MAGMETTVHLNYAPQYGPASKFIPPTLTVQEEADAGGGKPSEPNALVFVDPRDGETHVYLMSEKMRQQVLQLLTGGIVIAGGISDALGGDGGGGE